MEDQIRLVSLLIKKSKRIAFLTGAGVSVAAGIPDFRSPGGMYDTLKPELLTATEEERALMRIDPTAVVSTDIFYDNQFPYLELRRPFILGVGEGKWKPTLSHHFMNMCHKRGKLQRVLTQNIDGLDFETGLTPEKIISVHGTMGQVKCEFCAAPYPIDKFRFDVKTKIKDIYKMDPQAPAKSSNVLCLKCERPGVKPATVLYGGQLPPEFAQSVGSEVPKVDLLIVMGTSLTVSPANMVPGMTSCPRIFIDRADVASNIGITCDDEENIHLKGDCDEIVWKLIKALGWQDDVDEIQPNLPEKSQEIVCS